MSPDLQRLEEKIDSLCDGQAQICDWINGSGSDPGVKVRLDRLEQAEGSRAKVQWTVATLAVTGVFGWLWSLFTGRPPSP